MTSTDQNMTILSLVSDASLMVQGVMAILLLASLVSWYLIFWRSHVLQRLEKQSRRFQREFRSAEDMTKLHTDSRKGTPVGPLTAIFSAGYSAFYTPKADTPAQAQADHAERAMLVEIGDQEEELEKGLSLLATIGSVSPYVGLLGTVWGIMNSFIGLSQVEQATLTTVAPGIAEALIATAIGLFAAIPAVVAYNRFSASASRLSNRYYLFGNELMSRMQGQSAFASRVDG